MCDPTLVYYPLICYQHKSYNLPEYHPPVSDIALVCHPILVCTSEACHSLVGYPLECITKLVYYRLYITQPYVLFPRILCIPIYSPKVCQATLLYHSSYMTISILTIRC